MTYREFVEFLAKVGVETQSDILPPTYQIYWERFKGVESGAFSAACEACCLELNRFPSVAQIRERLPITGKSDWDRAKDDLKKISHESIFGIPDNERGSDDLESRIDALTDDELVEIFRASADPQWMANNGVSDAGLWFSVRKFRANPNGAIYRGVIRDQLREMA